jgi:hypothetical protein
MGSLWALRQLPFCRFCNRRRNFTTGDTEARSEARQRRAVNGECGMRSGCCCLLSFCLLPTAFSFAKSMPGGGMRQCAKTSIEKTRVFDPHMSARWAHRFDARVHFEKSYPGGALLKCLLADPVKTSVFRPTLVHDLCSALARGALSDRTMRPAGPKGNSRGRETVLRPRLAMTHIVLRSEGPTLGCTYVPALRAYERRVPVTITGLTAGAISCRPFRAWNRRGAACTK